MPASSEALRVYQEAIRDWPEVETRKMFGYPCAFARGQMVFMLHHDDFAIRLGDEARAAFIAATGAVPFEPQPGRAMREYALVPPDIARSPEVLAPWFAKALAYARTLPPKEARPRKRRARPANAGVGIAP